MQAAYKVQPLSQFLGRPPAGDAPTIAFIKPLTPQQEESAPEFFNVLNFVLQSRPTNAVTDGMADAQQAFAEFKKTQLDTGK